MASVERFMAYTDMTLEDQKAWAERLRGFRRRYRVSQPELARALGINRSTVGSMELCRNRPWPQTVARFLALEQRYAAAKEAELDDLEGIS